MPPILQTHNNRLQSLRGLAALMVALGHSCAIVSGKFNAIVGSVFQQNAAVILFYVLSGFVLGESMRRHSRSLIDFFVRRAFRLLPVFWCSIVVGILVARYINHPVSGASDWFNVGFVGIKIDLLSIFENATSQSYTINGVLWSIQVELWLIPVFPMMVSISDRMTLGRNAVTLAFLAVLSSALLLPIYQKYWWVRGLSFHWCFLAGILLPRLLQNKYIGRFLANGYIVGAELAGLVALQHLEMRGLQIGTLETILDGAVSLHLIGWVVAGKSSARVLEAKPFVWLGDISYSFYVYSQLILGVAVFWAFNNLPAAWWQNHHAMLTSAVIVFVIPMTLVVGALSYALIELTGMRLGITVLGSKRGNRIIAPDLSS